MLCVLLVALILPTIVSQPTVHQYLIRMVNKRIPGKIALAGLDIGWTTGVQVHNLDLKDPEGRVVVAVKNITLEESLTKIITSPLAIGKLVVQNPRCTLIEENGKYSVERIFSESKKEPTKEHSSSHSSNVETLSKSAPFAPLFADISVENGSVTITKEKVDEMRVENISCKIKIKGFEDAKAVVNADIINGKQIGKIDIQAHAKNYEKAATTYLQATCNLSHIPVDCIDTFISLKEPKLQGIARAAIGPTLDVAIQTAVDGPLMQVKATIQSAQLQANVAADVNDSVMKVAPGAPGSIHWKITPEVFEKLKKVAPQLHSLNLMQIIPIQVIVRPEAIALTVDSCHLKDTASGSAVILQLKSQLEHLFEKQPCVATADLKITFDDTLASQVGKEVFLSLKSELPSEESSELRTFVTVNSIKLPKPLRFGLVLNTKAKNPQGTLSVEDLFGSYLLTAPFEYVAKDEQFKAQCEMKQKGRPEVVIQADVTSDKQGMRSRGTINALPLLPIAEYLKNKNLLEFLANEQEGGATLSGNWTINNRDRIEATLQAKDLSCQVALAIKDQKICAYANKKPFSFQATVTPARFKLLNTLFGFVSEDQQKSFELKTPAELQLSCTKLEVPLAFSFDDLDVEALFDSSKIELGSTVISPLHGMCTVQKGSRLATFSLKSTEGSQIVIQGKAQNLWNKEGLQPADAEIEIESHIQELPIDLFKRLTCSKKAGKQVEALIGSSIDINASAKLSKMEKGDLHA
ncbi:MAG: hypothetical protein JWO53_1255, partial [Chlamydiia bacterium]|nr:hypothetical protein [Chlamydiia bacterium]